MTREERVKRLLAVVDSFELGDALRDALNERAGGKVEPSILDEKWSFCRDNSDVKDIRDVITFTKHPGGVVPLDIWHREIAAMPDAYRALNMVAESVGTDGNYMSISMKQRAQISDALKKAGIE